MNDMEKRLADKIKIGQLTKENEELKTQIKLNTFVIDDLLNKVEELAARLGVGAPKPSAYYPAYCNTGKELK